MAVESAEDIAAFFNPADFGEPMTAALAAGGSLSFAGIVTTGHVAEAPGTAQISMMVPRIIATRAETEGLKQDDTITLAGGKQVRVNDCQYKGALVIIHFHEHW